MAVIGEEFTYRHKQFRYLTGFEGGEDICWWCGQIKTPLTKRSHFCKGHSAQYWKHFDWASAKKWALKRADYTCQECGRKAGYSGSRYYSMKSDLEVHHIVRVNKGEGRFMNVLNVPCNLIVLCLECHGKTRHSKTRSEKEHARKMQSVMELPL